jgi:hypothetical protein
MRNPKSKSKQMQVTVVNGRSGRADNDVGPSRSVGPYTGRRPSDRVRSSEDARLDQTNTQPIIVTAEARFDYDLGFRRWPRPLGGPWLDRSRRRTPAGEPSLGGDRYAL